MDSFLNDSSIIYENIIEGLIKEDRRSLRKLSPQIAELNTFTKSLKDNVHSTISKMEGEIVEASPHYVQVLDYMREMAHCLTFIDQPVFRHIDNNHKGLIEIQHEELRELTKLIQSISEHSRQIIIKREFDKISEAISSQENILDKLINLRKKRSRNKIQKPQKIPHQKFQNLKRNLL